MITLVKLLPDKGTNIAVMCLPSAEVNLITLCVFTQGERGPKGLPVSF